MKYYKVNYGGENYYVEVNEANPKSALAYYVGYHKNDWIITLYPCKMGRTISGIAEGVAYTKKMINVRHDLIAQPGTTY